MALEDSLGIKNIPKQSISFGHRFKKTILSEIENRLKNRLKRQKKFKVRDMEYNKMKKIKYVIFFAKK